MPNDVYCIVCGEGSKEGGVIRLNPPGETGLWACFKHKSLFATIAPTEEVEKKAAEIRASIAGDVLKDMKSKS